MSVSLASIRIGVCGVEESLTAPERQRNFWPSGYPAIVAAAGAEPVVLGKPSGRRQWPEILREVHGVIYAGNKGGSTGTYADEQSLCLHCRDRKIPLLAIDHGLHTLNATFGGSVYLDLA